MMIKLFSRYLLHFREGNGGMNLLPRLDELVKELHLHKQSKHMLAEG
jgi:hypothetical protein